MIVARVHVACNQLPGWTYNKTVADKLRRRWQFWFTRHVVLTIIITSTEWHRWHKWGYFCL